MTTKTPSNNKYLARSQRIANAYLKREYELYRAFAKSHNLPEILYAEWRTRLAITDSLTGGS